MLCNTCGDPKNYDIYIEIQGHVVAVLMGFLELSGSSFTKTWTGNQPSGI